jgi:glycosyltransferase involved in cell wall biosynthesis
MRLALIGLRHPVKMISNINRKNFNTLKTRLFIESLDVIEEKVKISLLGKNEENDNHSFETTLKRPERDRNNLTTDAATYLNQKILQSLKTTVSVIIPTKNAGDEFETSLAMILNQKGIPGVELIIVDSGSTDDTLAIAEKYGAVIIQIDPGAFTHSYSRNRGAEIAKNDLLFFTVQDALLPGEYFFYELISYLEKYSVTGVTCAEMPRYDADLFYRLISSNHYKFLDVYKKNRILSAPENDDFMSLRKNCQISDIAFLVKKDIFLQYKYILPYAEDLDLGIRLLHDKKTVLFLGTVRIIHSHNRPPYYFLRRAFVDSVFLKLRFDDFITPSILLDDLLVHIIKYYGFLQTAIHEKRKTITLPCQVKDLKLNPLKYNKEGTISSNRSDVIFGQPDDNDFSGFIQKIAHLSLNYQNAHPPDNSILLSSFSFHDMLIEYMEENYELVDDEILEDYFSSLNKIFALVTGAYLAYCYLTDKENPTMKPFYEELIKNI